MGHVARESRAKPGLVEPRFPRQGLGRRDLQQKGIRFGAVAGESHQRDRPGGMGQKVDEGQQAEAEGEAPPCFHSVNSIQGRSPAAGVPVGEDEVGMGAIGAAEAKNSDRAPLFGQGRAACRVPGVLQIAARHRRQGFRWQINQIGQRAIGACANADRGLWVRMVHGGRMDRPWAGRQFYVQQPADQKAASRTSSDRSPLSKPGSRAKERVLNHNENGR